MAGKIIILCCAVALSGCFDNHIDEYEVVNPQYQNSDAQPQQASDTQTATTASSTEGTAVVASPAAIAWTVPDDWQRQPAGGMRLLSVQVPHDSGAGDLSVISLMGDGGGLVPNINRWRNQVGLDPLDQAAVARQLEDVPSDVGTFRMLTLINPDNQERAICAAVLQGADFFLSVKLTASPACVRAHQETFREFCAAATRQSP